jgi:hypothetical protein
MTTTIFREWGYMAWERNHKKGLQKTSFWRPDRGAFGKISFMFPLGTGKFG